MPLELQVTVRASDKLNEIVIYEQLYGANED